jgi:hypothetical protein
MTWVTVAVASAGGALASGYLQGQAAKEAAGISAGGARYAADINKQMFDITNANYAPYRQAGQTALNELVSRTPELTKAYTAEDFAQGIDPGYQFRLAQGQKAYENQANRAGGLISGNALQGMQDYTQGQASQEFANAFGRNAATQTNIFNRLKSIADTGLTATGGTANAATTAGESMGSAGIAGANAQAAGVVGQANAYGNTLQSMANYATMPLYMGGAGGAQSPYSAFYTGGTGGGSASGGGIGFNGGAGSNLGYMNGGQGLSIKT